MKKVLASIFVIAFSLSFAQAPKKFNYQSIARDGAGNFIPNQLVSYDILIHQTTTGGAVVYEETQQATTNNYGLVNLSIGTGTVVSGSMAGINWAQGPYFLEVKIDPTGGTAYTLSGTQELVSVPYALYAENSGTPGPQGNGIDSAYVKNDSLYLRYTSGATVTAGYVKGNTGAQGVSITNVQVVNGQVQVSLSNSTNINAGQLPYKTYLPFTFGSVYTSSTTSYTGIALQVLCPQLYGTFTGISAELTVNYLTSNATTTGMAALMDYGNYTGGAITPITGSSVNLPATNNVWSNVTSSSFMLTPGTLVRVAFMRQAGTGTVQIEGALLTLTFN